MYFKLQTAESLDWRLDKFLFDEDVELQKSVRHSRHGWRNNAWHILYESLTEESASMSVASPSGVARYASILKLLGEFLADHPSHQKMIQKIKKEVLRNLRCLEAYNSNFNESGLFFSRYEQVTLEHARRRIVDELSKLCYRPA